MKVLIVKTSSLGDVIHTLPAVTAAKAANPDIQFDWLVEESLAQLPAMHPGIERVIPLALRRWRKQLHRLSTYREIITFYRQLRQTSYDLVIDAQGLLKSAVVSYCARGKSVGYDKQAAREPLASKLYDQTISVTAGLHAIEKNQQLFAQCLGYAVPETISYGLQTDFNATSDSPYVVLLHGTTWHSKRWPAAHWQQLAKRCAAQGLAVYLPWGNADEKQLAEAVAATHEAIHVLPQSSLKDLAAWLANAKAVVAVDTGLAHLAAALSVPTISLYGATDPKLTGTKGHNQQQLQADLPCMPCLQRQCYYQQTQHTEAVCLQQLLPETVIEKLLALT